MTKSAFDELPEQATDIDAVLAEAATITENATPPVKDRKPRTKTEKAPKLYPQWNEDGSPQLDEAGVQVQGPVKMAKPKAPKPIEYELNEDGSQKLDEAGNPIVKKTARAPRLDADGNPLPRRSNVYLDKQIIRRTEAYATHSARADSKRGQMYAALEDGITVGEFYEKMGGKDVAHTFLVFFVNEWAAVTIETPQE